MTSVFLTLLDVRTSPNGLYRKQLFAPTIRPLKNGSGALKKYLLSAVLGTLVATTAQAATQTLETSDYSFSYDDAFWTGNLSQVGNTFTFAGLGVGASVEGTGDGAAAYINFNSNSFDHVVKVSAHAGNQIVNINTSASGYSILNVAATVGASASFEIGIGTPWTTDQSYSKSGASNVNVTVDTLGSIQQPFTISSSPWIHLDEGVDFLTAATFAEGKLFVGGGVGAVQEGSSAKLVIESISYTVSVSPVPEPESYALLLAGLGLVGTIVRRRKQK